MQTSDLDPARAAAPIAAPAGTLDPATDPSLDARAEALLGRMTLREKLAQLVGVWGFAVLDRTGRVDHDRLVVELGHGVGEISRLAGSTNLTAAEVGRAANEVQRFLVEETRLGIPALIHEETIHGLLARDAPVFQQAIGAAASWDPDLVERVAATFRRRMLATGARHALAPVLDTTRDPRWGRVEETYGEDPYLAAVLGVAYVRGIQGDAVAPDIIATGKHLVGHGLAEGGLNMAPVHAGWREIRDEQLLPFEAAIREAGLGSVMPAYCDVDGVPCHASIELLGDILRREWAFDGLIASDYMGIEQLLEQHRVSPDMGDAGARAILAGVDLELPRAAAYGPALERLVEDGTVPVEAVDAAVHRVLRAKLRLGLFERPYVEVLTPAGLASLAADEAALGRALATRSLVLLENDGVLPLDGAPRRLAVVGPLADSARDLIGDYSHMIHIQTLLDARNESTFGVQARTTLTLDEHELADRRTILDALRDRFGAEWVTYASGGTLHDASDEDIAQAAAAARDAQVAIVVVGERSGLTDDATTGEFRDRRTLGLIGRQQALLEAVAATGTPVVLVVVSGRPLALDPAAAHAAAVLLAWVPGDEGPDAIAATLAGDANPGGKLPVSLPRDVGQVPWTYRHHPSGGRSNPRGDHVDGVAGPRWAFGFGRSYTTFTVDDVRLDRDALPTDGGTVTVTVRVTNTGSRPGDEVVQLYLRDEDAQVARPLIELAGFARIALEPGAATDVAFLLHAEQLAYTGIDYRRIVEPGRVTLSVGTSSADRPLSAPLLLVGPVTPLPVRRVFTTRVTIRPLR
jgi:beta-glucosidase